MALLQVLLLLLGLGVAVSSASLQKRIVGGRDCRDDERLYHVLVLFYNDTNVKFCGGSLISDQWVLTAAHCRKTDPGWVNVIHVGVHPQGGAKQIYAIAQQKVYRDIHSRRHDIMLVKLQSKTRIQPIRLPDCPDTLLLGTKVHVAGFGMSKVGPFNKRVKTFPDVLQCGDFKIAKHEKLEKILAKEKGFSRKYQKWYSVSSSKRDVSKGDSGGGLVFKNRLYGVSSFAGDPDYALNAPNGFMDVCAYKQWIDDTIK